MAKTLGAVSIIHVHTNGVVSCNDLLCLYAFIFAVYRTLLFTHWGRVYDFKGNMQTKHDRVSWDLGEFKKRNHVQSKERSPGFDWAHLLFLVHQI